MKLSAAIRIGSMTTKHITGKYKDDKNGRCAVGAAFEAVGLYFSAQTVFDTDEVKRAFPLLPHLENDIIERNDILGQTREQIADWVETIEALQEGKLKTVEPKLLVEVK